MSNSNRRHDYLQSGTPHSTGSNASNQRKRKSFSSLLRKRRPIQDEGSDVSDREGEYSSQLVKNRDIKRRASCGTASSASTDPSSVAGSAFSGSFSGHLQNLPGGSTVSAYPPIQKQSSADSLYSPNNERRGRSETLHRIMRRRSARKDRQQQEEGSRGSRRAMSPESEYDDSPRRERTRRHRSGNDLMSRDSMERRESPSSKHRRAHTTGAALSAKKRAGFQSPRSKNYNRSPARSPRRYEDEYKRSSTGSRKRSYSPDGRRAKRDYSPRASRARSPDDYTPANRGRSSSAHRHSSHSTSSRESSRRRKIRSNVSPRDSSRKSIDSRKRSHSPRRRVRRADTYPSPKDAVNDRRPTRQEDRPRRQQQRSMTPPRRSQPRTRPRSPSAPEPRESRKSKSPTQYRLSELVPECRLYHIEARGGRRDFRKWFQTLPPNVKVDKDMKTDRGVFKKDNFANGAKLDEYLGIQKSLSPAKDRKSRRRS